MGSGDRALKRVEDALRSEASLRLLVEQAPDGIYVTDAEGGCIDVNPAGAAMVGYSRDEIRAMNLADFIPPESVPRFAAEMARAREGHVISGEWTVRRKDGSTFPAEIVGRQLPDGRLQGIVRDVTGRNQAEDKRMAALQRQRDALVREVHHRIKNHLQGVIGLLRNAIADTPSISEPLETAIGKIRAIAMVYGMPGRPDEGRISLPDLVQLVAESSAGPVGVEFRPAPALGTLTMTQEEAVPIALVANELVANALKHLEAPDPRRPVRVSLSEDADGVRIEIAGGPSRLPPGFDYARGVGIGNGLELVSALMAGQKARLTLRQSGDEVVADFRLARDGLN